MSKRKQRKFLEGYAEGGVVRALKNRQRILDEAEKKAITPSPSPMAPPLPPVMPTPAPGSMPMSETPAPEPNRVPIGPINREVSKQALQVKKDADMATQSLGLRSFAEGGTVRTLAQHAKELLPLTKAAVATKLLTHSEPLTEPDEGALARQATETSFNQRARIFPQVPGSPYPDQVLRAGLRPMSGPIDQGRGWRAPISGYADGDMVDPGYGAQPYQGIEAPPTRRRDSSFPISSSSGRIVPGMAQVRASRVLGGTPELVGMAAQNRGYRPMATTTLSPDTPASGAAPVKPIVAPTTTPAPVERSEWAQGLNLRGPMPTVGETMGTTFGQAKPGTINPKTGYPMLADGGSVPKTAWGGPTEDNESTRVHSPIYKGPGGIWDGMPMFAQGGTVMSPLSIAKKVGLRKDPWTGALAEGGAQGSDMLLRMNRPDLALARRAGQVIAPGVTEFIPPAAGIVGAARSLMQGPEERAAFAKSIGAGDTPLSSSVADAVRVLSNVGNAATGGAAGAIGQGVANTIDTGRQLIGKIGPELSKSRLSQASEDMYDRGGLGVVPGVVGGTLGRTYDLLKNSTRVGLRKLGGYADGGAVAQWPEIPEGGYAVMTERGTGRKIILNRGGYKGSKKGMQQYTGDEYKKKMGWADGGSVPHGVVTKDYFEDVKWQMANGGQVNRANVDDGMIFGDGGPTDDQQLIAASPGEFIVPADSAKKIGKKKLRSMVAATHTPVHLNQGLRGGYADGDDVRKKDWRERVGKFGLSLPGMNIAKEVPGQVFAAYRKDGLPSALAQGIRGTAATYIGVGEDIKSKFAKSAPIRFAKEVFTGEPPEAPAKPAPAAPATPVVQSDGGIRFPDDVSDRNPMFRQQGVIDLTQPIRGSMDAFEGKAPEGGGTISGVDPKTGLRKSVSYTKESMPAPMGVTDTSTPEQKAADKARRAEWAAQSQAIDERAAASEAAHARGLAEMNERGQLAGAAYDRRQAVQSRDPEAYMSAMRTEDQIQRGQQLRGLQDTRTQQSAAEMAKAKMLAEAEKYRTDQGLRGQMYQADAGLYKAAMDAERAAATARLGQREKNQTDTERFLNEKFTQYTINPTTGKQEVDPYASQQMKQNWDRYMRNVMINNPQFLAKFPGATSVNDIPREQMEPLYQQFRTQMSMVQDQPVDKGDTPLQGLPTDFSPRKIRAMDWINMPWNTERNSIGLGEALWGASGRWNPFVMPEQRIVSQTGTAGSPTHNVRLDKAKFDTPEKRLAYIDYLESTGKKEQANDMRDIWQIKRKP